MLRSLSIRNIVLIEALELEFGPGLTVLTGETGAGKSILMEALGFATGQKVRRDLVRAGADQGSVAAEFRVAGDHPVHAILEGSGLPATDGEVILRRTVGADGPSRGFINDQRVSAPVLAEVGSILIEVHGQHDDRSLLNPRMHRLLLDEYAGLGDLVAGVRRAWAGRAAAERALAEARTALEQAAADADFLRHSVEELEALAPQRGEDVSLDAERRLIRQAAQLTEEIASAATALSAEGAEGALGDALSRLTHIADRAEGRLEPAITAIDRTVVELAEAQSCVAQVLDALTFDPGRLDDVEERLFAIRGLARKHSVQPEELPELVATFAARLAGIDAGEDRIAALKTDLAAAQQAYQAAAAALSAARQQAAQSLDPAVSAELAPLRMENARFVTEVTDAGPGPDGIDAVRFTAAINPGSPAGPIDRVASGGELARFLLALKVQLAAHAQGLTMIFDEIDRGIGGATADAVGRRLSRLAAAGQVLVVTHSPQVAARADHHYRILKSSGAGMTRTDVAELDRSARADEIARMLAGDRVTDEARAAARALME